MFAVRQSATKLVAGRLSLGGVRTLSATSSSSSSASSYDVCSVSGASSSLLKSFSPPSGGLSGAQRSLSSFCPPVKQSTGLGMNSVARYGTKEKKTAGTDVGCGSHLVRGMIDGEAELRKLVEKEKIETVCVVFPDHLGRLMGKRYDAEFFLESIESGGQACNYLLTVDIDTQPRDGFRLANWQAGYGDFQLKPVLSTLRHATWLDRTAMVLCDLYSESTGQLIEAAPRTILKRQVERLKERNMVARCATELEHFVYNDSYRQANAKSYKNLEPVGWFFADYNMMQGAREEPLNADIRSHLKRSGVPVETYKGEWGLGQGELNVAYADALTMADRHMIFKQCSKEVADQHGKSLTFMAKVSSKDAGSSCHIHMSLYDTAAKRNPFCADPTDSSDDKALLVNGQPTSHIFRHFLAGWMAKMPELMPFYAPTINSYKRFSAGTFAPTSLTWSTDNRSAGFRIVGKGDAFRIECRIPGADCNPYMALSASIASGLWGIDNRIEPEPEYVGNAYEDRNVRRVPYSLSEAIDRFAESEFAVEAFGEEMVTHYLHHFRLEQKAFNAAVTDWEQKRYFEQV